MTLLSFFNRESDRARFFMALLVRGYGFSMTSLSINDTIGGFVMGVNRVSFSGSANVVSSASLAMLVIIRGEYFSDRLVRISVRS